MFNRCAVLIMLLNSQLISQPFTLKDRVSHFYTKHRTTIKAITLTIGVMTGSGASYILYKNYVHRAKIAYVWQIYEKHAVIIPPKEHHTWHKILYFGMVAHEKGLDGLIEITTIPDARADFKVFCITNTGLTAALAEIAKVPQENVSTLRAFDPDEGYKKI